MSIVTGLRDLQLASQIIGEPMQPGHLILRRWIGRWRMTAYDPKETFGLEGIWVDVIAIQNRTTQQHSVLETACHSRPQITKNQ